MSYTLHGAAISTCVQRVRISAAVAGIDVKLDAVKDFTDIYSSEWTKHQPFNQMPYLTDKEGNDIFESRAIAKSIAAREKSPLLPTPADGRAYALFEQGCSIEQSNFDPAASGLAYELVFSKKYGAETDEARVKKLKEQLSKRLDGYERLLERQKYIGGDKLTLADLFHLPYGRMVVNLGVAPQLTDGSKPNLARWWKEISELPEWQKLVAEST